MGRKAKYSNDDERRRANLRRMWLRDLPRQIERVRTKHLNLVHTLRSEGMEELLTDEERTWL